MRELMMFGLEQKSLAELEQLQAELRTECDDWRQKYERATGVRVVKGGGRRSRQFKAWTMASARDPLMMRRAQGEMETLQRYLNSIERELWRRADAAARA